MPADRAGLVPFHPAPASLARPQAGQGLAAAVRGLEDLPKLVPILEDLGRRHVGYGAKTSHYKAVGAALLWSLEQVLGDTFTPETHVAWLEIYGVVARTMLEGARKAEAESASA